MKKRILMLLTVVAQMMVMLAMRLMPAVARPLHKNATKVISHQCLEGKFS
jgi:hypothetical protein